MKENFLKPQKINTYREVSFVFKGFKCHPYRALKIAIVGGESLWGQHKFIVQGSWLELRQPSMNRL